MSMKDRYRRGPWKTNSGNTTSLGPVGRGAGAVDEGEGVVDIGVDDRPGRRFAGGVARHRAFHLHAGSRARA